MARFQSCVACNGGAVAKPADGCGRSRSDHRIPLFQVWRDHRCEEWPKLLAYWGLPNFQVINRDAHVAKCAIEVRYKATRNFSSEIR